MRLAAVGRVRRHSWLRSNLSRDSSFERGQGTIRSGKRVLAVAYRELKMYKLELLWTIPSALLCEVANETELWHRRLGHIGLTSMQRLHKMVDGFGSCKASSGTQVCTTCIQGKQTKLPHNQERRRTKRPLELVHNDLCGPVNPQSYDVNVT